MAIFRQYIAPLLVVIIFLIALVAVSARIFLPSDMSAPAPLEATFNFDGVNKSPLIALVNKSGSLKES